MNQQMDVVFNTTNLKRRRILVSARTAEVLEQFVAEFRVSQERVTILRREDDVEVELGEGLGHCATV